LDGVVVVTPSQIKNFLNVTNNVELVTNYPILDSIDLNLKSVNSKESKQACFAGGVTKQWNHHIILESFDDLSEITYKLAGPTSINYLNKLKNSENWRLVNYLGFINKEQVEELYNESICGLALLDYDTQVGRHGTLGNTKLFEYMKYGLPFICSDLELWVDIIDKHKCGIYVNPRDPKEISKAIDYLTKNPQKAIKMGENGKKAFIEEYNWDTQLPNLLNVYNKVADNK